MSELETGIGGDGRSAVGYRSLDATGEELLPEVKTGILKSTVQTTEEVEPIKMYEQELRPKIEPPSAVRMVNKIIDEAIRFIDEVLEIYDFEMERVNTFSLFEEKLELLWENKEEMDENFKDVLINLLVATKNSHYQKYSKKQYEVFKKVLKNIENININEKQVRDSLKILKNSKIDLFSPIRNWADYTIEIKKID